MDGGQWPAAGRHRKGRGRPAQARSESCQPLFLDLSNILIIIILNSAADSVCRFTHAASPVWILQMILSRGNRSPVGCEFRCQWKNALVGTVPVQECPGFECSRCECPGASALDESSPRGNHSPVGCEIHRQRKTASVGTVPGREYPEWECSRCERPDASAQNTSARNKRSPRENHSPVGCEFQYRWKTAGTGQEFPTPGLT